MGKSNRELEKGRLDNKEKTFTTYGFPIGQKTRSGEGIGALKKWEPHKEDWRVDEARTGRSVGQYKWMVPDENTPHLLLAWPIFNSTPANFSVFFKFYDL